MTNAEMRARNLISNRTTKQLIEDFEMTETSNDPYIPTVRGWIMDELEKRNEEAYWTWVDSDDESPRRYFLAA